MDECDEASASVSRAVFTYCCVVRESRGVDFRVQFGFLYCDYCWFVGGDKVS